MVFYALGVVDGSARIEGSLGLVCMSDLANTPRGILAGMSDLANTPRGILAGMSDLENTPRGYLNVYLHEKLAFFEVVSCTRGGIVPKKCVK